MNGCCGGCNQGRKDCDSAECEAPLTRSEMLFVVVVEAVCAVAFLAALWWLAVALGDHLTGDSPW